MTIDEIPVAADTDRVSDEAGGLFLYCFMVCCFVLQFAISACLRWGYDRRAKITDQKTRY